MVEVIHIRYARWLNEDGTDGYIYYGEDGFSPRIPIEEFRKKFHKESGHYPYFEYYVTIKRK